MSQHDPLVRIQHMLDHAMEAREITKGRKREDLDSDRLLHLALMRLLEVIGEAATRIPPELRDRYGEIPWRDIVDLRNRLIHGYDNINHDILWIIVTQELSDLIQQLQIMLKRETE